MAVKKITIEDLAVMVQKGFSDVTEKMATKVDMDLKFDQINKKVDSIDIRLERVEKKMDNLEKALSINLAQE